MKPPCIFLYELFKNFVHQFQLYQFLQSNITSPLLNRIFACIEYLVPVPGKLNVLDTEWVQVIFEPPELKVGPFEFRYGGESEVKLQITYIDEKIRLGKGSKGSIFVFQRRNASV